jgi:hypothetical protein
MRHSLRRCARGDRKRRILAAAGVARVALAAAAARVGRERRGVLQAALSLAAQPDAAAAQAAVPQEASQRLRAFPEACSLRRAAPY